VAVCPAKITNGANIDKTDFGFVEAANVEVANVLAEIAVSIFFITGLLLLPGAYGR